MLFGCTRSQSTGSDSKQYIPPTLVATLYKTPTADPFQPTEDHTAPCTNNLSFVEDLSVPDGTVYQSGDQVVKQWKVQNSGTCEWNSKYSVRNLSGYLMGAQKRQKLELIAPGQEGTVEITFTAPAEPGDYYTQWQAYDSKGKPFGDDFYMEIIVNAASPTAVQP